MEPSRKEKERMAKADMEASVINELKTFNLNWEGAKQIAKDRRRWRSTVEALCSTRSKED